MKRVRELTRDDSDASLFPCKRLRQLQSALGHRYEKRFVPSYPFDAALDSDPDAADLAHPDTAHSSPAGTTANLSWTTDVAGESAEGSSLSQVPCARTVTSRLLPARWEDSDAESDLDSEPDPTPDADMDLASSPSASPPPTHVGRFGFGFQHRERVARKSGVAAGVGTVSCAHPVLCCAMCGMRVLRAMCEVGIQVEAIHYEASTVHGLSTLPISPCPSPPPAVIPPATDDDVDMDLDEDDLMDLAAEPVRPAPPGPPTPTHTPTTAAPSSSPVAKAQPPVRQKSPPTGPRFMPGPPFASAPERHPAPPPPSLDTMLGRPVPKGPRALAALHTVSVQQRPKTPTPEASSESRSPSQKSDASQSPPHTSHAPAPARVPAPTSCAPGARVIPPRPAQAHSPVSLTTVRPADPSSGAASAMPPQPRSEPPPIPPPSRAQPEPANVKAHPPEPAAPPPPLPVQPPPPAPSPPAVPLAPSPSAVPPGPGPASALPRYASAPWFVGRRTVVPASDAGALGVVGVEQTVAGVQASGPRTSGSPPEPPQPPPPLPSLPPPPLPSLPPPPLPSAPPPLLPPGGASQGPTAEEIVKELMGREKRKRKREKRREVKKQVKAGARAPLPAKMNLPLRREGHDYQCPIDCRWFTMVGFMGHFEMKHEGRSSLSRRLRDELVKAGDIAEFWRQFWAHCDVRPEECHPCYVRADYDALPYTEDMEDGEIPDARQQQQAAAGSGSGLGSGLV